MNRILLFSFFFLICLKLTFYCYRDLKITACSGNHFLCFNAIHIFQMPHGMTCTTLCSKTITIRLFFHDHWVFSFGVHVLNKENIFSLTISAFQGQWTINWLQCKTDKKTQPTSSVWTNTLKRNAVTLWSACLAGNEVWQKVKTSCIREDQALFQALVLAFGDVQNGAAFLYFKTNFWKVSCSRLYDFWKGRASLTKRNLLEWLAVCRLRTEMMLFWEYDFMCHLSGIYHSV